MGTLLCNRLEGRGGVGETVVLISFGWNCSEFWSIVYKKYICVRLSLFEVVEYRILSLGLELYEHETAQITRIKAELPPACFVSFFREGLSH